MDDSMDMVTLLNSLSRHMVVGLLSYKSTQGCSKMVHSMALAHVGHDLEVQNS